MDQINRIFMNKQHLLLTKAIGTLSHAVSVLRSAFCNESSLKWFKCSCFNGSIRNAVDSER